MRVLDDVGDTSSIETREQYFQEVDEDDSGAIDFEEFMGVSSFICLSFSVSIFIVK